MYLYGLSAAPPSSAELNDEKLRSIYIKAKIAYDQAVSLKNTAQIPVLKLAMDNALLAFNTNHAIATADAAKRIADDKIAQDAATANQKAILKSQNIVTQAVNSKSNEGVAPPDVSSQIIESPFAYNSDSFIIAEDDLNKHLPPLDLLGLDNSDKKGLELVILIALIYGVSRHAT